MQHLEVSCAVRPIQWPLGVKWLNNIKQLVYIMKMDCVLWEVGTPFAYMV